ncbi:MAG: MTH1187 family thiamine-binding protein [Thermoguttaceae bacterium]|jgi:uncharacterized protein (TIGR00106 family)
MVVVEFSIYPLDKGESVGSYVARSLDIIDRSGLEYRSNAMGTLLEGEFDEVLDVIKRCFADMAADCHRVECSIKVDYRKDRRAGLQSKVASVERKLGRPLKK